MGFLIESTEKALQLILTLDREFVSIVLLSLRVSGTAVLISTFLGLLLATGLFHIPGAAQRCLVPVLNTAMGLPPVVVGLFLYLVFSRSGPLGFMNILYTPTAMVIAQAVLAIPIIAGIVHASMTSAASEIRFTALSLGASEFQATIKLLTEIRYLIIASVAAGLGRVIGEVGAVLIVGGNIAGYTRVMTTAIALEADRGDFILAIALGTVLLLVALIINILLYVFQKKGGVLG
jgi:tungstate transport system permease protein